MKLCDARLIKRELEECRRLEQSLPACRTACARALEKELLRRCDALAEVLWELAKFVEQIPDPELRLIFELRYFRGLGWVEIAEALPTKLTADGVRMKHRRYLSHNRSGIHQLIVCP